VIILEVADEPSLEESVERMDEWARSGGAFKYGIGPHALYSLPPRGHRRLIERSYDTGCLWACHVAESADELQAFCEQSGDLFLDVTQGKPWPAGNARLGPVHYALTENLMPSRPILFHCNYATSYELALLAAKRAFVAICHKYSADMEHKSFPIGVACSRGIRLCLGTEGMVPAGGANLFDELFRIKMAYPQISAPEMLRWVTKNPAAAIGASDKLGSITPGKCADIIGVRFPYDQGDDILETLLITDPNVSFVMVGGEEIIIDK
jgi:5-methylthioadenosine/S-adenosylhomocysteine deaminase